MRHKIAKWADRKSKMATTAAILKINFRNLFSNLRSLWAETCSVATGRLLNRNKLKLWRSKIQDSRSGSIEQDGRQSWKIKNIQTTSRPWPMAWLQNICTEVFHQWPSTKITKMAPLNWTKWRPELKIEKAFKRHLLRSQCTDFKVISQKCSSYGPLPKLLKSSVRLNKMTARAKYRKKKNTLNILSLASGLISKWFHRNVPLIPLYQNYAKMVLLCWIKWSPELNIEKSKTKTKNKNKKQKQL